MVNKCYTVVNSALCASLNNPDNGVVNCNLGDDGVSSYQDTCSFTYNTGYELTGSESRTCQSDGSWSGSAIMCRRGNITEMCDNNSYKMYNVRQVLY